jgi:hypothetical protein
MSRLRQLSSEEKEALVRRLEAGERVAALAAETGVLRKSLYEWRAAWRAMGAAGLNRKRSPKLGGRQQADSIFSRSLAVMGRQAPRERRAHLFAVIEKVTCEGSQGETKATAGQVANIAKRQVG